MFLSTLFSSILSLYTSFSVRDQVSHPCRIPTNHSVLRKVNWSPVLFTIYAIFSRARLALRISVWRNIALACTRTCLISVSAFTLHDKIQVNMPRLSVSWMTATQKETWIVVLVDLQEAKVPCFSSDFRCNLDYIFKYSRFKCGLHCNCTFITCFS
jgi:hypothetical protein